jgi:ParB-like chromosome segregation protein Spo0J
MMSEYQFHELCMLFPPCTDNELEELRNDIACNGLRTPITLYENKILDGRNRATACLMCGVEPRYKEYTGDEPLNFVISKNMCRRHLSESQRAMVAAKVLEYRSAASSISQKQAAASLNISERSVRDAARVRENAAPEVVEAVERGDKTVHAAVKEMRQSQLNADEPPSIETETEAKIKSLRRSILNNTKKVKTDLDALFQITGWSKDFKEIHKSVQDTIFDD